MKATLKLGYALSVAACLTCAQVFAEDAATEIRQVLMDGCKAGERRDVAGMIAPFVVGDVTVFDFEKPRSKNYEQLRHGYEQFVAAMSGQPSCRYLEIDPVILGEDSAYSLAIMQAGGESKDGKKFSFVIRSTDVWRKIDGKWKVVHEHNSFPVDMATGVADMQSAP